MYALIITARLARGIALALLILAMCLTIATASAGVAWRRRYWNVIGRTHYVSRRNIMRLALRSMPMISGDNDENDHITRRNEQIGDTIPA